jgi:predicted amidophosphoribosyltransferase
VIDAMGTARSRHCPVCRARFRGTRVCSRCGADLEPLMRIAARAWRLREAARDALAAGDAHAARECLSEAEHLDHTPHGARLRLLADWLAH